MAQSRVLKKCILYAIIKCILYAIIAYTFSYPFPKNIFYFSPEIFSTFVFLAKIFPYPFSYSFPRLRFRFLIRFPKKWNWRFRIRYTEPELAFIRYTENEYGYQNASPGSVFFKTLAQSNVFDSNFGKLGLSSKSRLKNCYEKSSYLRHRVYATRLW